MEGTDEIHAFVRALDTSIANLNVALEPALAWTLEQKIEKCNLPQERIKLYHDHLYTVISILFAYLKVTGVKTETHPIMKELTRIKQSMKNFKQLEEQMKQSHETSAKHNDKAADFLHKTLGTVGGKAAPDSLKSPAISSVNFKGTHTKFDDEPEQKTKVAQLSKQNTKDKRKAKNKVTKPTKRKT